MKWRLEITREESSRIVVSKGLTVMNFVHYNASVLDVRLSTNRCFSYTDRQVFCEYTLSPSPLLLSFIT